MTPYPVLDRPEVLGALFYPRREDEPGVCPPWALPAWVAVERGVRLGGRLYPARPTSPALVYFHGNGEIAADYDELAPHYVRLGISLLVIDYRGYGTSGGVPTATHLLSDARQVWDGLESVLGPSGLAPARLYVMGRSLGSAPAIEMALYAGERLAGLIVESGFADTFALLRRLGLRVQGAVEERDGFRNAHKLSQITARTLIIHGAADALIPCADGMELYRCCSAADKRLALIPGAGHNDLMWLGRSAYFDAIRTLVCGTAATPPRPD
jgi:hypothetical protein